MLLLISTIANREFVPFNVKKDNTDALQDYDEANIAQLKLDETIIDGYGDMGNVVIVAHRDDIVVTDGEDIDGLYKNLRTISTTADEFGLTSDSFNLDNWGMGQVSVIRKTVDNETEDVSYELINVVGGVTGWTDETNGIAYFADNNGKVMAFDAGEMDSVDFANFNFDDSTLEAKAGKLVPSYLDEADFAMLHMTPQGINTATHYKRDGGTLVELGSEPVTKMLIGKIIDGRRSNKVFTSVNIGDGSISDVDGPTAAQMGRPSSLNELFQRQLGITGSTDELIEQPEAK